MVDVFERRISLFNLVGFGMAVIKMMCGVGGDICFVCEVGLRLLGVVIEDIFLLGVFYILITRVYFVICLLILKSFYYKNNEWKTKEMELIVFVEFFMMPV